MMSRCQEKGQTAVRCTHTFMQGFKASEELPSFNLNLTSENQMQNAM